MIFFNLKFLFFILINFLTLSLAPNNESWADEAELHQDIFQENPDPLGTLALKEKREKSLSLLRKDPIDVINYISNVKCENFKEIILRVKSDLSWLDSEKIDLVFHFPFVCKNAFSRSFANSAENFKEQILFEFEDVKVPEGHKSLYSCNKCRNREAFLRYKSVLYNNGLVPTSSLSSKKKALEGILWLIQENLDFFKEKI